MGEVWVAEHTRLNRRAAIKLLHPQYAARPDIVARFFNEARAAASIADPGIVQIFDFDHTEADGAYIAMELLDGETLDARSRRLGVMPIEQAVRMVRQVASSLGAAHAQGIVHRDLKPENIFLARDPEVAGGERAKILDFGIAKLGGDAGLKTETSALLGTPSYMSPEQCRGAGKVDQRSDVYSLGCVLFAIVSGRPPFLADGAGELVMLHMTAPPPRLSSLVPGVSRALDDLVARCLAKDPSGRFPSGTELATALLALNESALEQVQTPARGLISVSVATTTLSESVAAFTPAPPRPPLRRGSLLVLAFVASVAIAGAGTAFIATRAKVSSSAIDAGAPSELTLPSDAAMVDGPHDAPPLDANVVDAAEPDAARSSGPARARSVGRVTSSVRDVPEADAAPPPTVKAPPTNECALDPSGIPVCR
jgi:serine/threonine-protein kinase